MELERLNPKKSPWYQKKLINEHVERYTFAKRYVKGKIVAELGCGTGYGSKIISENRAKKVYAFDIDKVAINFAKENFPNDNITYSIRPAEATNLPDKSVDVVISFETIEHLKDAEKCVNEIKRILKPGGICILSTPNKDYSYGDNPYHLKEFTPGELKNLLNSFSSTQFYGQRKVNNRLLSFYKYLHKRIPLPFFRLLLRFRPWEKVKIKKENRLYTFPYLYIITVCKK